MIFLNLIPQFNNRINISKKQIQIINQTKNQKYLYLNLRNKKICHNMTKIKYKFDFINQYKI